MKQETIHLGVDPGSSGALAVVQGNLLLATKGIPPDVHGLRSLLSEFSPHGDPEGRRVETLATLERIEPRPTYWNGRSSILKSTCLLYGNFKSCLATLVSLRIPTHTVRPQDWMKQLGMSRKKGESDAAWKGRLYTMAQARFEGQRFPKYAADAVLLAHLGTRADRDEFSLDGHPL